MLTQYSPKEQSELVNFSNMSNEFLPKKLVATVSVINMGGMQGNLQKKPDVCKWGKKTKQVYEKRLINELLFFFFEISPVTWAEGYCIIFSPFAALDVKSLISEALLRGVLFEAYFELWGRK